MLKKILLALGLIFVLLFGAAIALPVIYKDDIVTKVKEGINNSLNAKVNIGDFGLTLFKSFPDFTLTLEDFEIINVEPFLGDTLISAKGIDVTVDIMSIINGERLSIKKLGLNQPRILTKFLADGRANFDITKADTSTAASDTSSSSFDLGLQKLKITNGYFKFDDASLGMVVSAKNIENTTSGDFTQDLFTLFTSTTGNIDFVMDGVPYLSNTKIEIDLPVDMDLNNFKFTFKNAENIILNDLRLAFDGFIAMPFDDIEMDFSINAAKSDFKNFLSMIPGIYAADFKDLTANGKFGLSAKVKGVYGEKPDRIPSFEIIANIENGEFKYPSLPTAVKNTQMKLEITNPGDQFDQTVVNLSKLHIELGKEPFDATLLLKTPSSDPDIKTTIKGKIDLNNVKDIVPLPAGTVLAGLLNADVSLAGKKSYLDAGRPDLFNALGTLKLSKFNYQAADLPVSLAISNMDFIVSPQALELRDFKANFGKSDFALKGYLYNYLGFALAGETLKGTLNLNSGTIDFNELMADNNETPAETEAESAPFEAVKIPANIDFILRSSIDNLIYDDLDIKNFEGNIIVKDEKLTFQGVRLSTLGGQIGMNGFYDSKNIENPGVNFDLDVTNLDIAQTYKSFVAIQQLAPIAGFIKGTFTTKMQLTGDLNKDLSPILESLNGEGLMNIAKGVIEGFKPLTATAGALKMPKYQTLQLRDTKLSFAFENGKVIVKPFKVKQGNLVMDVKGSNGLDQTIDYKLKFNIPRAEFGGGANSMLEGLVSKASSAGSPVKLGETVAVNAFVGGTVNDPKVTLDLREQVSNLKNDLKDAAKNALNDKKEALTKQLNAEKERLRLDAEQKKKAAEDKIKAEFERKKKEAEEKAKAEVERLKEEAKKKAKEEAKKGLNKIFGPK
ncbi:MAG: hypothetical protein ACJATA_001846 [Sphingobacteriales bacterium]|jgi:hypothetical protein